MYSLVHHQFSKNKRAFALFLFLTMLILILLAAYFDASPILFQSRESKTVINEPVFNRISYVPGLEKDVWIMQQGHNGNDGAFSQWDRIGIVVVHATVKSAEFFQMLPGERVSLQEQKHVLEFIGR